MQSRYTTIIMIAVFTIILGSISVAGGLDEFKLPKDVEKGLEIFKSTNKVLKTTREITYKEEVAIGHGVAKEVFKRYGPRIDDPILNKYVNLVGRTVAKRSVRPNMDYRFAIINNNEANAFAAPGGYIFITSGLLSKLDNEAQLAGVLGHEIAHISEKHMLKTLSRSRQLAGLAGLAVAIDKTSAKYLEVVDIANDILFTKGLDKNLEYQADEVGTDIAAKSGYDAEGLSDFLFTLKATEGRGKSIFFQTHPSTGERLARLNRNILPNYGPGRKLKSRFTQWALDK